MKNIKIFLMLIIITIFTLTISACGGTLPEGLVLEAQASSHNRSADDSNYASTSSQETAQNPSAVSRSNSSELKFKGTVEGVTADTLTINGQTFTVETDTDLTTLFTAGDMFEIEFRQNQDGTISISQFHPEDESSDYDVEFKGMVDDVTADSITLNGEIFTVTTEEDLTTLFTAAEFYEIKYIFNEDGSITIVDFHFEDHSDGFSDNSINYMDDDDEDLEFEGMVEAVSQDTLTFNGETYNIVTLDGLAPEVDLSTLFTAGEFYEIEYLLNEDGSITIIEFHLEDEDSMDDSPDDDMDDNSGDDFDDDNDEDDSDDDDDDDSDDDEDDSDDDDDDYDDDDSDDDEDDSNDDNSGNNNN